MSNPMIDDHGDDDDEQAYAAQMAAVRDKDATLELVAPDSPIFQVFERIGHEAHRRLVMDEDRKLGADAGTLPEYALFRRLNWRGDEATGKVPRGRVVRTSEGEYLLTGKELRFEVNAQVWDACGDPQRAYIVDELWQSVETQLDGQRRQRFDSNGRRILTTAKPDVNTFSDVVGRHGAVFVEIARLVQAAAASGVEQLAFDFRTGRAPAPTPEPAPIDPEQIRQDELAKARAKRKALGTV